VAVLSFFAGLIFGSFFNVVIYRLPRGLSIVKPGSACTHCGHRLTAAELIPLFSFARQRGKCRVCGGRISWRYPVVELLTGLGCALVAGTSSDWAEFVVGVSFFSFLLVLALIDLEHQVLPNKLTVLGLGCGLLFSLFGWTLPFPRSLLGALVGFGLVFVIVVISRGGMGMGDAKLLALIGAFLGWKAVFYVLFWASVLGALGGLLYLYITKQDRKTPIPFGPSLAAAAMVLYFFL